MKKLLRFFLHFFLPHWVIVVLANGKKGALNLPLTNLIQGPSGKSICPQKKDPAFTRMTIRKN